MDPRSSFSTLYGDLSMTGMPGASCKSHSEVNETSRATEENLRAKIQLRKIYLLAVQKCC